MTVSSILTFAQTQAQTDTNGITNTSGLVWANEALLDFHRRLVEKGIDASQLQESSITGVAGTGVYSYPSNPSMIALKTIELNYADTNASNYKTAQQVDVANLSSAYSIGWLRNNADASNPQFDDRGDKFEIFPTPTSANNLTAIARLFYFAQPSVFTAVSNTVNYPENLDEGILGWRVAANYLYSLGGENIAKGDLFNSKYEERVKQFSHTLGRGSQAPVQAVTLQITGFEF